MAYLDTALLSEIQVTMIEPVADGGVTWTSGMWSASEVLGYLNQRQDRFMKESQLLTAWSTIAVTAGQLRPSLPTDWIATVRLSWKSVGGSTFVKIPLADSWSADMGFPTWPTSSASRPQIAMDSETPTLHLQLAPPSATDGTVSIYYVSTCNPLTGLGELMTVPDEFVPYIKWGVIADMLAKPGRAQDLDRSGYCEMRFEEGVTLAASWITGQYS